MKKWQSGLAFLLILALASQINLANAQCAAEISTPNPTGFQFSDEVIIDVLVNYQDTVTTRLYQMLGEGEDFTFVMQHLDTSFTKKLPYPANLSYLYCLLLNRINHHNVCGTKFSYKNNPSGGEVTVLLRYHARPESYPIEEEDFQVFPNPSNGNFSPRIMFADESSVADIYLYNTEGKELWKNRYDKTKVLYKTLYLPQLSSGIYLLELRTPQKSYVQKWIVQ